MWAKPAGAGGRWSLSRARSSVTHIRGTIPTLHSSGTHAASFRCPPLFGRAFLPAKHLGQPLLLRRSVLMIGNILRSPPPPPPHPPQAVASLLDKIGYTPEMQFQF